MTTNIELSAPAEVQANYLQDDTRGRSCALVDVRTPAEFSACHAVGAINLPLDRLTKEALQSVLGANSGMKLFFICQGGNRSRSACELATQLGFSNIASVAGGTSAWESANLPVVRGAKAISLERQVRIAAGALVSLGVIGGWLGYAPLFALSLFVGVGLIFAGVTDTCGMAMLLAKMPWNQQPRQPSCCVRKGDAAMGEVVK